MGDGRGFGAKSTEGKREPSEPCGTPCFFKSLSGTDEHFFIPKRVIFEHRDPLHIVYEVDWCLPIPETLFFRPRRSARVQSVCPGERTVPRSPFLIWPPNLNLQNSFKSAMTCERLSTRIVVTLVTPNKSLRFIEPAFPSR